MTDFLKLVRDLCITFFVMTIWSLVCYLIAVNAPSTKKSENPNKFYLYFFYLLIFCGSMTVIMLLLYLLYLLYSLFKRRSTIEPLN